MKKVLFLAVTILMMAAGCVDIGQVLINEPPTAYVDSISPTEASLGEAVSFDGHGTDRNGDVVAYRWRSSLDGDLSARQSFETSSLSEGDHTIYLKVQDNNGDWSEEVRSRVTVTGASASTPTVNSFDATPGSIETGESSTLSWSVADATTVAIDQGIGNVALNGTRVVLPITTTTYTLTATNDVGSKTATAQVAVSESPPSGGLPTINSFSAIPPVVGAGESTTLDWDVSDAVEVTIDPGVGSVDMVGTVTVSPAATTAYSLTASNAVGWRQMTIMVVVGGSDGSEKPDLVITDIQKLATAGGYVIKYTIKNNGTADAGESTSELYAQGVHKAFDTVPPLAAGDSVARGFFDWIYDPTKPVIKVIADTGDAINESDEGNNEKQVSIAVEAVYDFVERAPFTNWASGAGGLPFGGALDDDKGFACYRNNITLEDNQTYSKVLETHPQWVNDGFIEGSYTELYNTLNYKVELGEHFYARIGFVSGGAVGNVKFRVWIRPEGGPNTEIVTVTKSYDGTIETIDVPLSAYVGKKSDFILRVDANGSAGQDWATWIEAKIIR